MLVEHAPKDEDKICRRCRTKRICYPVIRNENRGRAKIRFRVEHVFKTPKLNFGFVKVRYRALAQEYLTHSGQ